MIDATQDPVVVSHALRNRETLKDWRHFIRLLRRYSSIYEKSTVTEELIN